MSRRRLAVSDAMRYLWVAAGFTARPWYARRQRVVSAPEGLFT